MNLTTPRARAGAVFGTFLRLGLTSFGGPVAHLGYFRAALVARCQWMSDAAYADLMAAAQFLPGPASSQVGMGLGLVRAGLPGAAAAWAGFTLPSALLMLAAGLGWASWSAAVPAGLIHGLKLVAVAVVAQAVTGMAASLAPDARRRLIALAALAACLAAGALGSGAWAQLGVIAAGGLAGRLVLQGRLGAASQSALVVPLSRRAGAALLATGLLLLAALPLAAAIWPGGLLAMAADFYTAGALVFGGGHVVLPLLAELTVQPGHVSADTFLAGYALAQALPGPLFCFAGFLGAAMAGWAGGLVGLVAVFAPGALFILGALPFWARLSAAPAARATVAGVNASVLGLLAAALIDPVASSSLLSVRDVLLAGAAALLLMRWRWPPGLVVLAGGLAGWAIGA